MGDEREKLLADVRGVVKDTLTLHHKENGYVTKGTCKANTQLLREGMKSVADALTRVHGEVNKQSDATEALGKCTNKLNTELVKHTAEHAGEEKAAGRSTGRWKFRLGVAGAIVGLLAALGTLFGWAYSLKADIDVLHEKTPTIVISKEAAKEIAKAVNGDDDEDEIY